MNRSRLSWQCRRGMKELDALLSAYLRDRYDDAPDAEKALASVVERILG